MTTRAARVGVIGTGWWSTFAHLPSLAEYERADLVAVADVQEDRARAAAERFGVPRAYGDHRAMLADERLDVVLVATPPIAHVAPVRDALEAGLDVLVEKPMTIDPVDASSLVDLAARKGRRLHVGYPTLHSTHVARLRAAVSDRVLGDLRLITSLFATPAGLLYAPFGSSDPGDGTFGPRFGTYGLRSEGGGQAIGQVTHSLSLLLFVTGLHPRSISAHTYGPGIEVDMADAAAIATVEGPVITLASTGSVPLAVRPFEQLAVFGTQGHAVLDTAAGELDLWTAGGRESADVLDGLDRFPQQMPSRHLVDCYLDDLDPIADGRLGVATTSVIHALLESARSGTSIDIPVEVP